MEKLLKATNEKKEYKCEICGRSFQNPQACKMHEKWKSCQRETSFDDVEDKIVEEFDDVEDPNEEELTLEDLGFDSTPEPTTEGLACSECGAKLTGEESSCPKCGEAFE